MWYDDSFAALGLDRGTVTALLELTRPMIGFIPHIGTQELLIILVIALLLFGRRLPEVGRSLGRGIVEFKRGVKGLEDEIEDESNKRNDSKAVQNTAGSLPQSAPPSTAPPGTVSQGATAPHSSTRMADGPGDEPGEQRT